MPPERRLIINSSAFECRAALLEDGVVAELFVERARSRGIAGNIYLGRVRKILPGMQCAFVDIGLDRDAFLYVADVAEPPPGGESVVGAAIAETLDPTPGPAGARSSAAIEALLREGEQLLVQVAKEPMASKGARVTTHVTLPGRCLVYMPTVQHLGVSRRIETEAERARLRGLAEELRERPKEGFIIRTAAEGHESEDLQADARRLREQWDGIVARCSGRHPPLLLHAEARLLDKLLRDVATAGLAEIVVDSDDDRARVAEYVAREEPGLGTRVRLHPGPRPLFEELGVESEIERALRSKVWLKSGGYIVINQTEALVAIDVNSGRYVGKASLEETVLAINLEAVREIVRQIRLRDLGGIIVLDLIDMESRESRAQVLAALETELRRDRSKSKILQISDFGLVEMTRKRVKGSLERLLTSPCRACGGSGRVKSVVTVCHALHRELLRTRPEPGADGIELRLHPVVVAALEGPEQEVREAIERELGHRLDLHADPAFALDHFEVGVP